MAANVNLTAPIRQNLLSLQNTARTMGEVQNRLATGLKVNSAIDNPASFFTAKSLNDRAFDLSARLDGIGQGIQTLKAADQALNALNDMMTNAKSLANRALDEVAETITQPKITTDGFQATHVSGTTTVSDISGGTTFSGAGAVAFQLTDSDGNVVQSAQLAIAGGTSIDSMAAQMSNLLGVSAKWETYDSGGTNNAGRFVIEGTDDVRYMAITNSGASVASIQSFVGAAATTSASASTSTDQDAKDTRQSLAEEFNDLRSQMQGLVKDAGYKGVNLLNNGDLTVKFNEKGDNKLNISGVNFDPTSGGSPVELTEVTNKWATDANVDSSLEEVEAAISAIRTQASKFGSNLSVLQIRESFTTELINTLEAGAGKLVQADMNEESAKMLSLQTRQQLSTTSLSMASQSEQAVLRLF